jgi:hypothetical protein
VESSIAVRVSLAKVWNLRKAPGESLIGIRESLIGIGESLIGIGESLIGAGESLIGIGESLIGAGESLIGIREALIAPPPLVVREVIWSQTPFLL